VTEWGRCWRRQARRGRCGGSKDSIKEGKALGGGSRRLVHRGGSRVDEADAEAEAKRVSIVTLPLLVVGAGGADGMSFENNLSKSDTIPLLALVGG